MVNEVKMCGGCPFDFFAEKTEIIQNYGCLPTPHEIMKMRIIHGKTWACHSDTTKPCVGALSHLKKVGFEYKMIDDVLVDEKVDWSVYCKGELDILEKNRMREIE